MPGHIQRIFDIQLIIIKRGHMPPTQPRQRHRRCRPQSIILPPRIAIAQHQNARTHCFTRVAITAPSASSNVTINGISPNA